MVFSGSLTWLFQWLLARLLFPSCLLDTVLLARFGFLLPTYVRAVRRPLLRTLPVISLKAYVCGHSTPQYLLFLYVRTTGRPPASPEASAPARSSFCSCTTGGPPASLPPLLLACFFPNFGNETMQTPIYLLIGLRPQDDIVIKSILE